MADLSRNNCHSLCNFVKILNNYCFPIFTQSFVAIICGDKGCDSCECLGLKCGLALKAC